jgi:hypothetical protein
MVDLQIREVDAPTPFSRAQQWFGIVSIVGFPWLQCIPSLGDVTLETKKCTLLLRQKRYKSSYVTMETGACSLL